MGTAEDATLYVGEVMHRRHFPVRYRFAYRVFSLLLDVDRLEETAGRSRLFSHNRFNVFSVYDRDHGPRDGTPLARWVETMLAGHGITLEGGRVLLLSLPRIFGYAFNPLSLWYCLHRDGRLLAVLCEVKNTFGEQHGYLLHDSGAPLTWPLRREVEKRFHVSPFISMYATYRFRLSRPDAGLAIGIQEYQEGRLMLVAAQTAAGQPFNDRNLLHALLAIPLLNLKVIAAIHWQALKIWLRGAPVFRKPLPPPEEISG
ncbi:MAG: DUF1365 domain-containing protein [Nitrospirota bacterium]